MKIFNSKIGEKEEFVPLKEGVVGIYLCGPTVYDSPHLGHGRSAVSFDLIRRYFLHKGFSVKFVSNYTDVDDKMIKNAEEKGVSVSELAELVIPEYENAYDSLGIMRPDAQPRATDHIPEMIEIINDLEQKGFTYALDDGVYFDVSKYPEYGRFSGQNLEDLQMGARVDVKKEKRNPQDFVLWKFKKEGEPFWASPWGDGRPGWHIECSAMSYKLLGEKFDIHGGGLDLKFPHHECEVAQSLCCFGPDSFAKYWMHNGFIQIDNEKMSKSLGNFFTLKEIFEKYDPKVVRFMFLQTHYRNPINFSDSLLEQAKAALGRLRDFVARTVPGTSSGSPAGVAGETDASVASEFSIGEYKKRFEEFMDNDFDTAGALGVIFELVKEINSIRDKGELSKDLASEALEFLREADEVLAVIFEDEDLADATLADEIEAKIKERDEAREQRDFAKSDAIRDELLDKGIVLEDTPQGTVWKKR